jgi:TonB family protein
MAVGRAVLVTLGFMLATGPAVGQELPRDVGDPSITNLPSLLVGQAFAFEYPGVAVRDGLEGEVMINTCVNASGKPNTVKVSRSSGHAVLDEATRILIARHARFKPAEAAGIPIAVCNYSFIWVWKLPGRPPETSR